MSIEKKQYFLLQLDTNIKKLKERDLSENLKKRLVFGMKDEGCSSDEEEAKLCIKQQQINGF